MSVEELMADPPRVHEHQGADAGAWATTRECYEFIEAHVGRGDRTVETGCGLSTAVFAGTGSEHIAVFLDGKEGDILRAWAAERGVDLSNVTLITGGSDEVLPSLSLSELDLVLIDGGHGFPLPIIDWYYTCRHLKRGGLLVVDDCHLAPVQRLVEFLDHDARWQPVVNFGKWAAWRRLVGGPLGEEWTEQQWLPPTRAGDVTLVARGRKWLRPVRQLAWKARRLSQPPS